MKNIVASRERPLAYGLTPYTPVPNAYTAPQFREGIGFVDEELDLFLLHGGWAFALFVNNPKEEGVFMNLEEKALEASASVTKLIKSYMDDVGKLKGTLQNDSASIKAAAARIEKEHEKINAAMQSTIALMTSPAMADAIQNAERLAAALHAISEAKSASGEFAVVVR